MTALRFGSADSAGATCVAVDNDSDNMNIPRSWDRKGSKLLEASIDQLCIPLPTWAYRAGARETIFMNPKDTKIASKFYLIIIYHSYWQYAIIASISIGAYDLITFFSRISLFAVVTCGGLCPGLNDVIQGLVNKSTDYGVPEGNILGIRYGFKGFYDKSAKPIVLTKHNVEGIHLEGGTILGTSRGGADIQKIVKQIDIWGIDICFVVGGNGGNAGAATIQAELARAKVPCAVVGVPKSIDNDILLIDKCFGYDTAVEEAQRALICAKVEATSAFRGVGVVKVMGRQSGFIAVNAAMASGMVDIVSKCSVCFI